MLSGLENPIHLLLVFIVILLVFGAKRLPEVGRGLGAGIRDFKHAVASPPLPVEAATSETAGAPKPRTSTARTG